MGLYWDWVRRNERVTLTSVGFRRQEIILTFFPCAGQIPKSRLTTFRLSESLPRETTSANSPPDPFVKLSHKIYDNPAFYSAVKPDDGFRLCGRSFLSSSKTIWESFAKPPPSPPSIPPVFIPKPFLGSRRRRAHFRGGERTVQVFQAWLFARRYCATLQIVLLRADSNVTLLSDFVNFCQSIIFRKFWLILIVIYYIKKVLKFGSNIFIIRFFVAYY